MFAEFYKNRRDYQILVLVVKGMFVVFEVCDYVCSTIMCVTSLLLLKYKTTKSCGVSTNRSFENTDASLLRL
jgi:hypothetical protein